MVIRLYAFTAGLALVVCKVRLVLRSNNKLESLCSLQCSDDAVENNGAIALSNDDGYTTGCDRRNWYVEAGYAQRGRYSTMVRPIRLCWCRRTCFLGCGMMVQPVIHFALVADWTSDQQLLPVDLKSGKLRVEIRKLTTLYSGNHWPSEKLIAMISKSASKIHCKPISRLLVSND